MGLRQSPGSERQFVRMDTWFQANLESPGQSRGASPRTPRSDGEGLFDTFDEDARWDDRAPPSPNVLRRPPTPVAERAAAAPQPQTGSSLLRWGSLLGIVAPQPASAVAGGSGGRGQTSDAVLEHAAVLVQRLIRGKIARLDAAEVTRRFKLLELYVRCTPRLLAPPPPTPHTPRHTPHAPRPVPAARLTPRASHSTPPGQARAEENAAMVIQRCQRHRLRCRLERAALRVEAVARGRIARQSIPPKAVPVSGAYCSPRDAGGDLDLTSLRGPIFKRSRGLPRYQLRYMYVTVDSSGQAALCHRASDAVGGGTGVEKQLPLASITAVHVESWGRRVLTRALNLTLAPALALALTLALARTPALAVVRYVFSVHSRDRGISSCRHRKYKA